MHIKATDIDKFSAIKEVACEPLNNSVTCHGALGKTIRSLYILVSHFCFLLFEVIYMSLVFQLKFHLL